jgi:hypothetical protein
MSKKVLTGAERKAQLLEAGAKLASKHGAANVTRRMVATACKCAEGLVNRYMGDSATAQKAYARKAKAMGLPLPDKARAAELGAKLRKHKPKDARDTRKRSPREVKAIKDKAAGTRKVSRSAGSGKFVTKAVVAADPKGTVTDTVRNRETKPTRPARTKPTAPRSKPAKQSPGRAPSPPETKSAARAPKAPPASVVAEDQPAVALPMPPQNSFP